MLILRLWNYIRGYVIIMIEGYFPEKFINICMRRSIFLWDINRTKSCVINAKIGIKDYKKIRTVAKKSRCRVSILAKKGLPILLNKYKRRKAFVVGCFIFIGMICVLSSFIWSVEIFGNSKVPTETIIQSLNKVGLKTGSWKPIIATEKLSSLMLIRLNELSWINIDITGTRAIVKVVERVMPPKITEKNVPCNIVASKDGVIISVFAKEGTPVFVEGDTVKKGDLLIAGLVESADKNVRFVHAMGSVKARTWYEESVSVPLQRKKVVRTGQENNKYSLKLFNNIISFGINKSPYEFFDSSKQIKQLSIGKNYILPFSIIINKYFENKTIDETISKDQARLEAVKGVWEKTKFVIPVNTEVKNKKLYLSFDGKAVKARVIIESIEEIGIQENFNQ